MKRPPTPAIATGYAPDWHQRTSRYRSESRSGRDDLFGREDQERCRYLCSPDRHTARCAPRMTSLKLWSDVAAGPNRRLWKDTNMDCCGWQRSQHLRRGYRQHGILRRKLQCNPTPTIDRIPARLKMVQPNSLQVNRLLLFSRPTATFFRGASGKACKSSNSNNQ